MVLFPIRRYHPYSDPIGRFLDDQMDFFDPWDDFDAMPAALAVQPHTFRWVHRPRRQKQVEHRENEVRSKATAPHAEKFRVQLNVAGFTPESIKTRVDGRKVIIEAKQEDRQQDGDYSIREIRKSYDLPEHADASQMVSYVTPNNMLVIEVPIRNPEPERVVAQAKQEQNHLLAQFGQYLDPLFDYLGFLGHPELQPRIVDKGNNEKQLEMTFPMNTYKPDEVKVSVKNNQLIVQGEHRHKDDNRSERTFFFKTTTLPPGTQVDQLQSRLTDDGQLRIEAPFVEQKQSEKSVQQHQNK